ncbi:translational GTPase TypA [bacterium (Candidatus Torokbacteria) CG09_land_8_20_14_0_10_42_11]|nr:MAG: translational GTPase TypA [bacterium (Candidatus Torokbacteria) CG09_land_8_20_14_0_10_42_11]
MQIRNIAIIAHVDHGKTSLTDALMRQTGAAEAGVSMDSNDLEKERGITIYSKNTSIFYKGTKINIVDTPGHVDFGSEVERVLRSIDAVILVVDSQEGPMPQTKFVLKKSLELGLKPIVVINKIDKEASRPKWVHDKLVELFIDLGADDHQIEFPVIYAIAREGIAKKSLDDPSADLTPLLDLILKDAPIASSEELNKKKLKVQPFNLAYDDFMGRLAICRIYQGLIYSGDKVYIKKPGSASRPGKIAKVFTFQGLERKEVEKASSGDIAMLAGLADIDIGETICADPNDKALPAINIDEPTISLNFLVNNSPFMGKEGTKVTTRQIRERLEKELEVNVGLKVDFSQGDFFKVYGRGELHIAILLENMRREGYELQVSQPQVIFKEEKGVKLEPFEELTLNVPNSITGIVIEKLSQRKGMMISINKEQNYSQIIFEIPTRGLLGYRGEFVIDTKGEGILYSQVIGFRPFVGEIAKRKSGAMISMAAGVAVAYALYNLQNRGSLYIGAGEQVYPGMVIGNTARGDEMTVNPTKGKHLTNVRSKGAEEALILTPPLVLTIERGLEIINNDEYLEITPQSVRLRKKILSELGRIREKRKK